MSGEGRWHERRAEGRLPSVEDASRGSYYSVPAIHNPHWGWLVALYFYLGGLSAGAHVVASVADLVGGRAARPIVRLGRYVSLLALLPCPPLLIADLGRPERFLYMLRVVKLRSPMSVGVWGLLGFSGVSSLAAVRQLAIDGVLFRALAVRLVRVPSARALDLLGLGPGFFLGSYTGVLLAATAVPLWTRPYLLLGPLFLTSAVSNGTAAISLLVALAASGEREALRRLESLERLTLVGELGLLLALRVHLGPLVGRPLDRGRTGILFWGGVLGVGVVGPLSIHLLLARWIAAPRVLRGLASVMVMTGGVLLRFVVLRAGGESADDPQATFETSRLAAN